MLRNEERPAPITSVKGTSRSPLQLLRTGILTVSAAGFPNLYTVENQSAQHDKNVEIFRELHNDLLSLQCRLGHWKVQNSHE